MVVVGVGGGCCRSVQRAESAPFKSIPGAIPVFPQGAVTVSRPHALYIGSIHRTGSTCDRDRITGMEEGPHVTARVCKPLSQSIALLKARVILTAREGTSGDGGEVPHEC